MLRGLLGCLVVLASGIVLAPGPVRADRADPAGDGVSYISSIAADLSRVDDEGTTRVSVSTGGDQANSNSWLASVSDDGRFVAFRSYASNLVNGDTNGVGDIFLRDRKTETTTRVSVASDGTEANGESGSPSISADGRYVAFYSLASNLVPGDTNNSCDTNSDGHPNENCPDVFVHDAQSGRTTRASVDSAGTQGNGWSAGAVISGDGRYVLFTSLATNLVPDDTNGKNDVFVHDRQTGLTTRISVDSAGVQGNGNSYARSISRNGRYVAFDSCASNLVPGDTNGACDVFVHDRQTGVTSVVSVSSAGAQGNGHSGYAAISDNGRYVAFSSGASNLVPGDTNGQDDVFVHDRKTGATTRASVDSSGAEGNDVSTWPAISGDGRYVGFASHATNLVPDDANGFTTDVFMHDRRSGITSVVPVNDAGVQENSGSQYITFSRNGRYAVFDSFASNLVPDDTNGRIDIFVRRLR